VKSAVLLIDEDLAFGFWLAKALDLAGYEAYPARNVPDAITLLSEMQMEPRVLILGGASAGADALVALCRVRHKDMRVIRLLEGSDAPGYWAWNVDAECRKPARRTKEECAEMLLAIDQILASEPLRM